MSTVQLDITSQAPPASPKRPELASKSSSRATKDLLARVVMWAAFFVAVIPLVWILGSVLIKGGQMLLESLVVDQLAGRHHPPQGRRWRRARHPGNASTWPWSPRRCPCRSVS